MGGALLQFRTLVVVSLIASGALAEPPSRDTASDVRTIPTGFVRVGPTWIDARPVVDDVVTETPDKDAAAATTDATDALLRELATAWILRIKAIRATFLDPGETLDRASAWAEGRKRILAIHDPLAIPALTRELSRGGPAQRRLLIESLTRFPQDSATLNLAALALLDESADVRELAAIELAQRADKRVEDYLRAALDGEDEWIIRRAATALGRLKSRAAVPGLIERLRTDQRVTVRVPRHELLAGLRRDFSTAVAVPVAPGRVVLAPAIAVVPAASIGGGEWTRAQRTLTIYRTEVLDALVAITGQHFGFDVEAWRRWVRTYPEAVVPAPS